MRTTREPQGCPDEDCVWERRDPREATEWAPVCERDGTWSWVRFCPEHAEAATRYAVGLAVGELGRDAGGRMAGWSFETFPADDDAGAEALAAARRWLEYERHEFGAGLLIYGPQGTGKTGLAFSCAVALLEDDPTSDVRFVNTRQVLGQMKRSFGTDERYDPTDELIDAETLVLDDLGAERVTDWARETLATIIEARYVDERETIVTSNYAPSQLARRLGKDDPVAGKRIASRLAENATQIHLDRRDLRAPRSDEGDA